MDVANFMSAAFVGRIEDEAAARDALRMRVSEAVGYEAALANLSAARGGSASREFVMRDVDGNVEKVCVQPRLAGRPQHHSGSPCPCRFGTSRRGAGVVTARVRQLAVVLMAAVLPVLTLASPVDAIPGISDCKDSPTPEVPGRGIAGFFAGAPMSFPARQIPSPMGQVRRSSNSTGTPDSAGTPTTSGAVRPASTF